MFSVPVESRGISLEFATAGPVPETVLTDPTRLRQIIANLVGNAIKFTEKGGVKIVARLLPNPERPADAANVPAKSAVASGQLAIDVIDSGIGISPEGLGKIFNPFVQADSTVTRRFGGTGLGLAIDRRFATALGGELTVVSELGKGSTFTVTLDTGPLDGIPLLDAPQAKERAARSGGRSAKELPKLPPARVLIVDDGEANRQLITVILTRAGLHVESAENGEVAVRMAASRHFDLILMDMQMPVMDGYTATTKLRQQGLSIPIVALTASVMKGTENKCGNVGCSAYVAKPVDFDELMCCLAELLKGVAGASQESDQGVGSSPRSGIPPPSEPADGESLRRSVFREGRRRVRSDPGRFRSLRQGAAQRDVLCLAAGHFATLAQLAGSVRETADVSARGEFHAVATHLEKLAEQQAIAEIEDSICELAILSESIALLSHESDEQPSVATRVSS